MTQQVTFSWEPQPEIQFHSFVSNLDVGGIPAHHPSGVEIQATEGSAQHHVVQRPHAWESEDLNSNPNSALYQLCGSEHIS